MYEKIRMVVSVGQVRKPHKYTRVSETLWRSHEPYAVCTDNNGQTCQYREMTENISASLSFNGSTESSVRNATCWCIPDSKTGCFHS